MNSTRRSYIPSLGSRHAARQFLCLESIAIDEGVYEISYFCIESTLEHTGK
jgi:hypothetical protein